MCMIISYQKSVWGKENYPQQFTFTKRECFSYALKKVIPVFFTSGIAVDGDREKRWRKFNSTFPQG